MASGNVNKVSDFVKKYAYNDYKQKIIIKKTDIKSFIIFLTKKSICKIMKCKNCKSKKLIKVVKLGKQPISSVFYEK